MERQTILERLGWRFIRKRGSEFYIDPDRTINRVIIELNKLGIMPESNEFLQNGDRNTELLSKVKTRAAVILEEISKEECIEDNIIETALNIKDLINVSIKRY